MEVGLSVGLMVTVANFVIGCCSLPRRPSKWDDPDFCRRALIRNRVVVILYAVAIPVIVAWPLFTG